MSSDYPQKNNTNKNLILSLFLVGVVIVAGYFVFHNTSITSNLALVNNSPDPSSNNPPNPLPARNAVQAGGYPKEGFSDAPNNSFLENLTSLVPRPVQHSSSDVGSLSEAKSEVGGDPLISGGFKILGTKSII